MYILQYCIYVCKFIILWILPFLYQLENIYFKNLTMSNEYFIYI